MFEPSSPRVTWNLSALSSQTSAMIPRLGLILDPVHSLTDHVHHICRECLYHLRQLRIIRHSLSLHIVATLVHALIWQLYPRWSLFTKSFQAPVNTECSTNRAIISVGIRPTWGTYELYTGPISFCQRTQRNQILHRNFSFDTDAILTSILKGNVTSFR